MQTRCHEIINLRVKGHKMLQTKLAASSLMKSGYETWVIAI
jgi:hypothetical protein